MTSTVGQKINEDISVIISAEHAHYLYEMEECFPGLTIDPCYIRKCRGELPMKIIIFLGGSIVSGLAWDMIKLGIQKVYDKFSKKELDFSIKFENIFFSIDKDGRVKAVTLDHEQFSDVKTLDDLYLYIKGKTQSKVSSNEWEKTTLGEVCSIMSGSTPSTKEELYRDGDISWITPKDLSNHNERYITKGERNITEEGLKNSSAQLLPKNSILFSSRAPIGYVAIAENELTTNQGFKNIVCDEEQSHYLFFYYLLKYRADYIEKISSGSTFSEVSASIMKSVPIHLPPLPEQQAIVAVLSSFDDKIELLRAENQTLEQMGKELFKERFGKWKVGDELPEGWRVGKIEDLTNYIASGGTPATKEASYYGGRINWFSTKELQDCFLFSSEKTITEDALKNSSAKEFPKDTVLMAIYAAPTVGRLGILTQSSAFNQAAVGLVAKDDIGMPFIYLLLKFYRDNFNNLANGAAQQNLNVSLVKNYGIIIPDQETLSKINLVIKPLFNKIRENSEQIQTLSATRDQLLPKLMSGEVRVEF